MSAYFDFKKNWHLVKPHLKNPELVKVLNDAMNDFLSQYPTSINWLRMVYPNATKFDYNEGHKPWMLCQRARWEGQSLPSGNGYRAYQAKGMCHWIARWTTKLGEIMFPQYKWITETEESGDHTFSIGFIDFDTPPIFFDILLFETFLELEETGRI